MNILGDEKDFIRINNRIVVMVINAFGLEFVFRIFPLARTIIAATQIDRIIKVEDIESVALIHDIEEY